MVVELGLLELGLAAAAMGNVGVAHHGPLLDARRLLASLMATLGQTAAIAAHTALTSCVRVEHT
jgi:hypothetical protein